MAAEAGTAPVAPPAGAGGGGGAQILQQIEDLLMQLAQSEPEPQIQEAIKGIQQQIEPLQQIIGKDDMQDMQSGLANPGGPPGEGEPGGPGAPGGGMPAPGGAEGGGGEEPTPGGGGGEHHVVEVHIGVPGGAKTFAGANKAAKANFAAKGHFGKGPKGEPQQTDRTKNKAKG